VISQSLSSRRGKGVFQQNRPAADIEICLAQEIFRSSRPVYDSFAQAVEARDYGVFVLGPDGEPIVGKEALADAR
jgi:hypothetical protein